MKVKINDKTYETIRVPQYNRLIGKLKIILTNNKQKDKFEFHGIYHKAKFGILVCGTDSKDIRAFEKFYSISDINFYFNNHIKNIKKHGERRLTNI